MISRSQRGRICVDLQPSHRWNYFRVRYVQENLHDLAIAFPECDALLETLTARALIEGALLADFDIDTYRSDRKDQSVHSLTVISANTDKNSQTEIQLGFNEGLIFGASQNFARSLVSEPGDVLTPTELGTRAKKDG